MILDSELQCCFAVLDCKTSQVGIDYKGTLSTSVSGKGCLPWSTTALANAFVNQSELEASSNYCRNPTLWAEGPHCVVQLPDVIEPCELMFCKGKCPTLL